MPPETFSISCTNNIIGTDNVCTGNFSDFWNGNVGTFNTPFFSAGDMFISLLLFLILLCGIIALLRDSGIFKVGLFKKIEMHVDDVKQQIDL